MQDYHLDLAARFEVSQDADQVGRILDPLAGDLEQDVTSDDPRLVRRAIDLNRGDDDAISGVACLRSSSKGQPASAPGQRIDQSTTCNRACAQGQAERG